MRPALRRDRGARYRSDPARARVNVAEINFGKGMVNDLRLRLAVEGRQMLEAILTMQAATIEAIRREFRHLSDFQAATLVMLRHQYGGPASPGSAPSIWRGKACPGRSMPRRS